MWSRISQASLATLSEAATIAAYDSDVSRRASDRSARQRSTMTAETAPTAATTPDSVGSHHDILPSLHVRALALTHLARTWREEAAAARWIGVPGFLLSHQQIKETT